MDLRTLHGLLVTIGLVIAMGGCTGVTLELRDGSRIEGTVVESSADRVVVDTTDGSYEAPLIAIPPEDDGGVRLIDPDGDGTRGAPSDTEVVWNGAMATVPTAAIVEVDSEGETILWAGVTTAIAGPLMVGLGALLLHIAIECDEDPFCEDDDDGALSGVILVIAGGAATLAAPVLLVAGVIGTVATPDIEGLTVMPYVTTESAGLAFSLAW